jgi:hypothetical protein
MRRSKSPRVEPLEPRTLQSTLSVSVATDKTVYQVGQSIQMTYSETNTSNQPVTVDYGPSTDGFDVKQNGALVWQSNAGINPLFVVARVLQPGQSVTIAATWSGKTSTPGSAAMTGTFTVVNQLDPQGPGATFQIVSGNPPAGSPGDPTPVTSPPALKATLTTNRAAYRFGQHVHIMLTLSNTSDQSVSIAPVPGEDGVTVGRGGQVWWRKAASTRSDTPRTILPGQSVTYEVIWPGRRNQPGARDLGPGKFAIQAEVGGYSATETIEIGTRVPGGVLSARRAFAALLGVGKPRRYQGPLLLAPFDP